MPLCHWGHMLFRCREGTQIHRTKMSTHGYPHQKQQHSHSMLSKRCVYENVYDRGSNELPPPHNPNNNNRSCIGSGKFRQRHCAKTHTDTRQQKHECTHILTSIWHIKISLHCAHTNCWMNVNRVTPIQPSMPNVFVLLSLIVCTGSF